MATFQFKMPAELANLGNTWESSIYEQVCFVLDMIVDGDSFSLSADSLEYKVTLWNRKEIVATNIDGICRVLNVLKFDLVQKGVYLSQTLSEPTNDLPKLSRELCSSVGMNLELKAATMWKAGRAKRDLHQP